MKVCVPTFAVGFSIYGTLKQKVFRLDSSIPCKKLICTPIINAYTHYIHIRSNEILY